MGACKIRGRKEAAACVKCRLVSGQQQRNEDMTYRLKQRAGKKRKHTLKEHLQKAALLVLAAFTLTACAGKGGAVADNGNGTQQEITGGDSRTDGLGAATDQAMGRYVESEKDISDISTNAMDLRYAEDGTLYLCDGAGAVYRSKDLGDTWELYELPSLQKFMKEGTPYFISMAMAPDGSVWAVGSFEEDPEDFSPQLAHFPKEGDLEFVTEGITEEDGMPKQVVISEDGAVYLATYQQVIYEISNTHTAQKLLVSDSYVENVRVHGQLLVLDHGTGESFGVYDKEKKEYVQDEVLNELIESNYLHRNTNGSSEFEVFYFFGNDDALYVAGKSGLHRHVIGGSTVEEVINGGLSILSNPNYWINGMVALPDNEFLMASGNGKLVHFTYDPEIASVPDRQITIYSLREQEELRSAITTYQTLHPDVYVNYETGLTDGSAMTRDDAVKNLNTRILSGEGPDILILDELPAASFAEKGLLLDLGSIVTKVNEKESLYTNLVEGVKQSGVQYFVPLQVEFPVIAGRSRYVEKMTGLTGVADQSEQMRKEYPSGDLLSGYSAKGVMRRFLPFGAASFTNEDGSLNRTSVCEFYQQTKRIYEAQMSGVNEEKLEQYAQVLEIYAQEYGGDYEDSDWFDYLYPLDLIADDTKLLVGSVGTPYEYAQLFSLYRNEGCEDMVTRSADGLAGKVYLPKLLVGILASSSHREEAENFVTELLSSELQEAMSGFSVNCKALEESFVPNPQDYVEGEPMYYLGSSDQNGNMVEEEIWWPVGEEMDAFYEMVQDAEVPYLRDTVLEEALFDAGVPYLEGTVTLEDAWKELNEQTSLYLSE